MCRETCLYSAAVRDVLIHLASCWIQGTVHSYIEQSGIQHCQGRFKLFSVYILSGWSSTLIVEEHQTLKQNARIKNTNLVHC